MPFGVLMSFQVLGTAHTGITVVDLERSLSFWRDVLGLKVVMRDEVAGEALEEITGVRGGAMSFAILEVPGGGGQIELLEYTEPADRQHLRPRPFDARCVVRGRHRGCAAGLRCSWMARPRGAADQAGGPGQGDNLPVYERPGRHHRGTRPSRLLRSFPPLRKDPPW
ncbi:VOC family protein [Amycolatopsis sp. NPDC051372]|uniref:VOC family protein n=1 Tax=Amycolatopsis sp. NPDC051372 TaxID=3155669 RepID=UPI003441B58B